MDEYERQPNAKCMADPVTAFILFHQLSSSQGKPQYQIPNIVLSSANRVPNGQVTGS